MKKQTICPALSALALLAILLLSSCYTAKVATKRISKANALQPAATAAACAIYYPTKDSVRVIQKTLPGRVDTVKNYVTIDCDKVIKDKILIHDTTPGAIITVPCPPSTHAVDTFIDHQYHTVENTAGLEALKFKIDDYNKENGRLSGTLKTVRENFYSASVAAAVFAALWILFIILWLKRRAA